jgi:L-ascorbate metabolism protein UlaG (beta-lactamase superfamily)
MEGSSLKKMTYLGPFSYEFFLRLFSLVMLYLTLMPGFSGLNAQLYTFPEIKEIFFRERPQGGDQVLRENCFGSIDDLILDTYPPLHPGTEDFYIKLVEKAVLEINNERVTEGATIWQIYNHGWVIKTPSSCFGFDLHEYFGTTYFESLADVLDAYFISHSHTDHYSWRLASRVLARHNPVVTPDNMTLGSIEMTDGENRIIAGLDVTAHYGLHSVTVCQFEVITPEGLKFLHTGDNQTSRTIPVISDVDVLLLNAWVNESGTTSSIIGTRNAIEKVQPKVTLPGHILELGHLGGGSLLRFQDVYAVDDGNLASEFYIPAWGERYHYHDSSNDTIRPILPNNLTANIAGDSVLLTWEVSQQAADGDTAYFYRLFQDDVEEVFLEDKYYTCLFDTIRTFNFKIYSYDDCGNQSENYSELDFTPSSSVNYPPRLKNFLPDNADTLDVFAGVPKLFKVYAVDFNGDSVHYQWNADQIPEFNQITPAVRFSVANLDSGIYIINADMSDQQLSTRHFWTIRYHTDLAIADNDDSLIYDEQGNWETSSDLKAYGRNCRYIFKTSEDDSSWAQFRFYPEKTGIYDIFEIIPRTSAASEDALYQIWLNDELVDAIHVDLNPGSGDWVHLKSVHAQAGNEFIVRVENDKAAPVGSVLFSDAIKFVYRGESNRFTNNELILVNEYHLYQNYPNPFNPITKINYELPITNYVNLSIFNLLGELVTTLVDEKQNAGYHQVVWDATGMASGVYYYKIEAGEFVDVKKMVLLR